MRRPTAIRLTAVLLVAGTLVACGKDAGTDPDPTTTSTGTSEATSPPVVTGAFGEGPTIELPGGAPGGELVSETLEEGDGTTIADGHVIVANYQAVIWSDDAGTPEPIFDTFAGGLPETFTMADSQVLKGMYDGLLDATVGSRVMLVIPPAEGFGEEGQQEMGIAPTDTLVFVFDVLGAFEGDAAAEGTEVAPDPALPTVTVSEEGPTATMPSTAAPTELISQVLIQGDGPAVESGQLLVAHYRGQLYKDGTEFDSSWGRNAPTGFPIGVGGVIPGWDKTLVGQAIGSRVLLVIPPAEGYGESGNPPAIAGDDTLVFVVDILGAYGEPEPTG